MIIYSIAFSEHVSLNNYQLFFCNPTAAIEPFQPICSQLTAHLCMPVANASTFPIRALHYL